MPFLSAIQKILSAIECNGNLWMYDGMRLDTQVDGISMEKLVIFHYDGGSRAGAVIESLANQYNFKGYTRWRN